MYGNYIVMGKYLLINRKFNTVHLYQNIMITYFLINIDS